MTDGQSGTIRVTEALVDPREIFRPDQPFPGIPEEDDGARIEEPFYGAGQQGIIGILEPEKLPEFPGLPDFRIKKKGLLLNIETTGVNPVESQLICISYLDPSEDEPVARTIIGLTPPELLREFIRVFDDGAYNQIIGYNVSFDLRFLFSVAERYRVKAANLFKADIYDVANIQKQVKSEFVFTTQKPGTLDEWAKFLWGLEPPHEQEDVFKAFAEQDWQTITEFNEYKVFAIYSVFILQLYVKNEFEMEIAGEQTGVFQESPARVKDYATPGMQREMVEVQCRRCLAGTRIERGATSFECPICGMINAI